jgi:hypothetical protein
MAIQKTKLALTLLMIYLIAVVPAFFITGSLAETLCFLGIVVAVFPKETIEIVKLTFAYFDPLKIVDGRYGMSGAWIGAAPIGFMVLSAAVTLLSSINNSNMVCKYV